MGARRPVATVIAALALTMIPAGTANARAHISGFSAFDQRLLADINAARGDVGLPPLQLSSRLEPVAFRWAQHQATVGRSSNNPNLRSTMNAACPGWRHVGETVGVAGESSADDLFNVYMRDNSRRDTLLNRRFNVVGVSTVATDEDGSTVRWNALEFANACSA